MYRDEIQDLILTKYMRDLLAYINYLTKMFRICLELENDRCAISDGKIQRKSTFSEILGNIIVFGSHIFH